MTQEEKIGGFLNGAQRELADQKAQPNPDQNAIAISERAVSVGNLNMTGSLRSESVPHGLFK